MPGVPLLHEEEEDMEEEEEEEEAMEEDTVETPSAQELSVRWSSILEEVFISWIDPD